MSFQADVKYFFNSGDVSISAIKLFDTSDDLRNILNCADCHETIDMDRALKSLDETTMLEVTEAYHESMCLFHGHLLGSLPDYCNCESPAWAAYHETKHAHGQHYNQTIDDMPAEVIQKVDDMTKSDKVIYKAAVQRFIKDVERMEQRFKVKILCSAQRDMLHQKADSA